VALFGNGDAWWALYYLFIPFSFVLTVIVFCHELGHFLVARWCGVRVSVFSVGFGPECARFTDRRGTHWRIGAFPIGGYVKFFDDKTVAGIPDCSTLAAMSVEDRRHSFSFQSIPKRAAIVAAGPIANFLLAIIIFAAVSMTYGHPVSTPRIDMIKPDSAAAAAGLKPGDMVLAINGQPIRKFIEVQHFVRDHVDQVLQFRVKRGDRETMITAVPTVVPVTDHFGKTYQHGFLGIKGTNERVRLGPIAALAWGAAESWSIIEETFSLVRRMLTGRESADQVGGPIGIALMSSEAAKIGFDVLLAWVAGLSVSIGIINLLPIPLFDGGHLLFYGIESLRGAPLSQKTQEIGLRIGLTLVLLLLIFATYNDIPHVFALFHRVAS
jgi:regulator of sigma E protease